MTNMSIDFLDPAGSRYIQPTETKAADMSIILYYLSSLPMDSSDALRDVSPEWTFYDEEAAIAEGKRLNEISAKLSWPKATHWYVYKIETKLISTTEVR
jgi:hypothetical protein